MNNIIYNEYLEYLLKADSNSVRETWVEKKLPNLYKFFSDKEGNSLSEKVYLFKNNKVVCKICKSDVKFLSYKRGYREYCSKKCSNSDKELIKQKNINYKINNIEKYGVDNPSKLEIIKDKIIESKSKLDYSKINIKIKNTCIKNFGVDNPSKSDVIKEKKKNTCIRNFGVDNPFQSEDIKDKIKEALINKYGVNHPLKSDKVKNNIKQTCLGKYGVDNPMKSEIIRMNFKKTCFNNWGFEHFKSSPLYKNNEKVKHINKLNLFHNENNMPFVNNLINLDYKMSCSKCNTDFFISANAYNIRKKQEIEICINCNPVLHNRSLGEISLYNFIKDNYDKEIVQGFRLNNKEIDIFLPDLKIGFEFNGVYWHSEFKKNNDYHYDKFKMFEDNNILLIQIWEDDWIYKKDLIKSKILNSLKISNSIYARKCVIKKVNSNDSKIFLNDNHLQGWCISKIRYGLYYNDKLVSLMTFGSKRRNLGSKIEEKTYELLRFCNKLNTSVIGGASKLLKYFKDNNNINEIISYSKNDYSNGSLYKKLGFNLESHTKYNYYWVVNGIRENRFNWRKDKLVSMGHDINLTEVKIMHNLGHWRCFDSGNKKWILKF